LSPGRSTSPRPITWTSSAARTTNRIKR
jgi:hypothetical protein